MHIGYDARVSITVKEALTLYKKHIATICEDGMPSYCIKDK